MTDREKVLAFLSHIGEPDEACIAEVIEQCKTNHEFRAYYVSRYDNVTKQVK